MDVGFCWGQLTEKLSGRSNFSQFVIWFLKLRVVFLTLSKTQLSLLFTPLKLFLKEKESIKITANILLLFLLSGPELDIINNIPNNKDVSNDDHPWYLWILVVSLSAIVFALLAALSFCVCCKRDGPKDHSETQSSTGACSDVERPFMPQTNPQLNSYYQKNNNKLLNKPLPPTPMTLAQWSSAIHPQTSPKYSADSGFNDHDNSKELNQYEVPYAHLLRTYRPTAPTEDIYFTQEAFMQPQNSIVSGYLPPQRLCNQPRYYTEYETQ